MKHRTRKTVVSDLFPVFVALAVALFVAIRGAEGPATVRFHAAAGDGGCASPSLVQRANGRRAERAFTKATEERKDVKEAVGDACREDRERAACRRMRRAVERADGALRSAREELWAARVRMCI